MGLPLASLLCGTGAQNVATPILHKPIGGFETRQQFLEDRGLVFLKDDDVRRDSFLLCFLHWVGLA
jgi:hypothetical protein